MINESAIIVVAAPGRFRIVQALYEDSGVPEYFKTSLTDLKEGDIINVESAGRWSVSSCKVVETDCIIDLKNARLKWVIGRVDMTAFERHKEIEKDLIRRRHEAALLEEQKRMRAEMEALDARIFEGIAELAPPDED